MVKGRFVEDIISGRKRATIRLGCIVPRYSEVFIHGGGKPVAKVRIVNVVYKRVCQLTEEDAHKDGYSSVEELIKDLENVYERKIHPNDIVTIIEFEVVKDLSHLDEGDVYLGLQPTDVARLIHRYLRKELNENDLKVVEAVIRYGSIREASLKLFGTLNKRWIVRKTLRKYLKILVERGFIGKDTKNLE